MTIPVGLCQCGCGQTTAIAYETRPKRGWVKGQPMPYVGHHRKNRWPVSDGVSKRCRKCLRDRPISDFHVYRKSPDGRQTQCVDCQRGVHRAYVATEKGRAIQRKHNRAWNLRQNYGLTLNQYQAMLEKQGGRCACCGRPETAKRGDKIKELAVDHCYGTGKARGLLCTNCNVGIGCFGDDPEKLRLAIAYLESFANPQPQLLLRLHR